MECGRRRKEPGLTYHVRRNAFNCSKHVAALAFALPLKVEGYIPQPASERVPLSVHAIIERHQCVTKAATQQSLTRSTLSLSNQIKHVDWTIISLMQLREVSQRVLVAGVSRLHIDVWSGHHVLLIAMTPQQRD